MKEISINDFPVRDLLEIDNKKIVVFDVIWPSNVFCFDLNGKLIWQIGKYGDKQQLFLNLSYNYALSKCVVFDAHNCRYTINVDNGSLSEFERLRY